jgi:hypothetical protein
MGRSKRIKAPRAAHKLALEAPAAPSQPRLPSWFDDVPPFTALAFIAMALATIPYGAPMPAWFMWTIAAVGAALGIALAADPLRRWRSLTYWPIPVILGVWACSIAACQFPREVLGRSWGMAFYSTLFLAAQVMCWNGRARKGLALAALGTVLAIAVDLWWAERYSRSLIREVPALTKVWYTEDWGDRPGGFWMDVRKYGSQHNQNDYAVVAVLLPLAACVLPTMWTWGLWCLGATAGLYDAVIVKSRQLMLGLVAGTCFLFGLHSSHKLRLWATASSVAVITALLLAHPSGRERILRSGETLATGRSLPIAYGVALYSRYPVFGIGPSLYGHYHVLGARDGWTFRGEPLALQGTPWVHSLPVEVACELGTVGLVGYGVVLWGLIHRLRKALHRGGPSRQLAVATTSAAVAMAFMSLVDLAFIKDWVRICWWLLLGLGFVAPTLQGAREKPKAATLPHSNGL